MLALFIVLFALSSIDAQKFERLARAFNSNFDGGISVLEYPSPLPQQEMENIEENKQNGKVQNEPHDNDESGNSDQEELAEVQNRFNQYIEENNLKNNIKTSLNEEGLLITIRDDILFDSGSAKVRKKMKFWLLTLPKCSPWAVPATWLSADIQTMYRFIIQTLIQTGI